MLCILEAGCPALGGLQKTIIKRIWNGVSRVMSLTGMIFFYHNENSLMFNKMRIYVVSLKIFFFLYRSQRCQEKTLVPAASVLPCSMGKICLLWQWTLLVLKHKCLKSKMQSTEGGNGRNILLLTLSN